MIKIQKLNSAIVLAVSVFGILLAAPAFAAQGTADSSGNRSDVYERARVISVSTGTVSSGLLEDGATGKGPAGLVAEVEVIGGDDKGKLMTAQYEIGIAGKLAAGDEVVINKPGGDENSAYVVDPYRLNRLSWFILLFFAVAIYFGRRRGLFAILGLVISVFIIFYYLVPRIIAGGSPLGVSLVAAFFITVISLFVAHGISKRTAIAFVSTILSLVIAIVTDLVLVYSTKLTGTGSEEAVYLQFGTSPVDLQGILLAGILIGVLGILDDITTAQAACVEEIHNANPSFSMKELYRRGLSVGREHIASLINTLVLAYVGISLPMILLIMSSKGGTLWVVMNSGFMAEEIVRTLVGSLVLVVAVPLTTFLASYLYSRPKSGMM